jgi:hypothetical protein
MHDLGRLLADFILARLRGETPELLAPPLELIVRESTAFVRGEAIAKRRSDPPHPELSTKAIPSKRAK